MAPISTVAETDENKENEEIEEIEEVEAALFDETIITCAICCEIFHRPVNVTPCNHKFCASCIYKWLECNPSCPTCRRSASAINASPDAFVAEIAEKFLAKLPALKRSPSTVDELDETAQRLQPRSDISSNSQRNNAGGNRRRFFGW